MKSTENGKKIKVVALVAIAVLPLALAGCSSGPPERGEPAQYRQPPPPLVGEAKLLDESVQVKATVAMGGIMAPGRGGGPRPSGGGMPPGGGMGGPPPGMSGGAGAGRAGGVVGGGGGLSHALSVVFTNTGLEAVEFTIIDVNSRLGNFVPQPDKLALTPGQFGALYPMRGNLPDDIAQLELTVTIQLTDGRTDTRVFTLKPAPASGP